jgi:hypothetical protein
MVHMDRKEGEENWALNFSSLPFLFTWPIHFLHHLISKLGYHIKYQPYGVFVELNNSDCPLLVRLKQLEHS